MAGGVGSRFWPMSTPEYPKQFVDVLGRGMSMIQMTVERFAPLCPIENMWVVTSADYEALVREQLPQLPVENILLEPAMRNTAPCIAYACWKIRQKNPSANVVVTPADALVVDVDDFRKVIGRALAFTAAGHRIVTVGIRPTRPETGYGYIEIAGQAGNDGGGSCNDGADNDGVDNDGGGSVNDGVAHDGADNDGVDNDGAGSVNDGVAHDGADNDGGGSCNDGVANDGADNDGGGSGNDGVANDGADNDGAGSVNDGVAHDGADNDGVDNDGGGSVNDGVAHDGADNDGVDNDGAGSVNDGVAHDGADNDGGGSGNDGVDIDGGGSVNDGVANDGADNDGGGSVNDGVCNDDVCNDGVGNDGGGSVNDGVAHDGADVTPDLIGSPLKVDSFREKPALEVAKKYLAAGNYLWNAGIFVWNIDTIVESLRAFVPGLAAKMDIMSESFFTPSEREVVGDIFPTCEKISIDYAVMEKADYIYTIPGDFGWSDVGTWGSLWTLLSHDEDGNAVVGENVHLNDCRGCIVHAPGAESVVLQGLEDSIVVERDGRLLVCKLSEEQRIKDFVK